MYPIKYPLYIIASCIGLFVIALVAGPRIKNHRAIQNKSRISIGNTLQDVEALLGEPDRIQRIDSLTRKYNYNISRSFILSECLHLTISNDTLITMQHLID